MFAGWIDRGQLQLIEYLQAENRLLKAHLGNQRLRFTDAEMGHAETSQFRFGLDR